MAVHFHPLRVADIRKDTVDSVVITFEVPAELRESFKFFAGQNITLKTDIEGVPIRRSYSICSAPHEDRLSVGIKKAADGRFSNFAVHQLKVGDTIEVLAPTGSFGIQPNPGHARNYLAFAAGSGITPIISLLKAVLYSEPKSEFTLVFGNNSRSSIMFLEELEGLKNLYPRRFNFINILSREQTDAPINSGRIDRTKLSDLRKLLPYTVFDEIFICGPEQLVFCIKDFLETEGIKPAKIHFELFTTNRLPTTKIKPAQHSATTGVPKSNVNIRLDGHSFSFDLGFDSDNILDAALKLGADLPYACKGGVCSTCRAKLLSGEVSMDTNYALEPEEVANGFILTCQSHPLTSEVFIDFDTR